MRKATQPLPRRRLLLSKALQVPSGCFWKYEACPSAQKRISGLKASSTCFLILPTSNFTLTTPSFASPSRFISRCLLILPRQLTRPYALASRCAIQIALCSPSTRSEIDSRHSLEFSHSISTCASIPASHSQVHSPSSQNDRSAASLAIAAMMDLLRGANSLHFLLAHNYRPSGATR